MSIIIYCFTKLLHVFEFITGLVYAYMLHRALMGRAVRHEFAYIACLMSKPISKPSKRNSSSWSAYN